ncbi:hypothetical protein [uncultured Nostoc sp.]|uniref:hypothetical protein n=1 Tax=uncultured Nostoc sp. TaxID=340711 RepID=UPI0035CB2096
MCRLFAEVIRELRLERYVLIGHSMTRNGKGIENQDRIIGLMFLLTLALRVFTLVEFVVRQALQECQ